MSRKPREEYIDADTAILAFITAGVLLGFIINGLSS